MPRNRRSTSREDEEPQLRVTHQEATDKITARITLSEHLLDSSIENQSQLDSAKSNYRTWDEYNRDLLRSLFTTEKLSNGYVGSRAILLGGQGSLSYEIAELQKDIQRDVRVLESIIGRLELMPLAAGVASAATMDIPARSKELNPQLFIVHGHDEGARESVARFLGTLDLDPIILNEEPNRGGTLIEKLDRYRDIGYAIVLLTPDDIGGVKDHEYQDLQPRARQNVVLELGYFIGALGRNRVATLHKPEIDMPSDYAGSAYIPMDAAGAWMIVLARELRDAGYNIDMNKVL